VPQGGDELLVLTPGLSGRQALKRARLIQRSIAAQNMEGKEGQPLPISVSVGVADVSCEDVGDDPARALAGLIARADEGKSADKLTKGKRRCTRRT